METTQLHAALLSLIERARTAQRAWIADLSDAERDTPGSPEQWSAKDVLAHITFWQEVACARLAAARDGSAPPTFGDFQLVNERIFEERRARPWAQTIGDAEQANATLAEHVRALDAEALTNPQQFAWANGRALLPGIVSNGFWHPLEHVARFYVGRGEPARAADLLEQAVVQEPALGALPDERGKALYNLACFYATTGQPGRALPLLPEALRLQPDLVEWSKQDSDLDELRTLPEFQALYQ